MAEMPVLTVQIDWTKIKYLDGEIDHLPLSGIAMMRFALEAGQAVEEHFRQCDECDGDLPCEVGEHLYGLSCHVRHLAIATTAGQDMSLLLDTVTKWSQAPRVQTRAKQGRMGAIERTLYDQARKLHDLLKGE